MPIAPRIEKTTLDGQPVWIKRAEHHRESRFVLVHQILSKFLPLALQPTNATSGFDAILSESKRLKEMAQAGIPVPTVLHEGTDHVVLSDCGTQLRKVIRDTTDQAERKTLLDAATKGLAQIHNAGLVHGRPHLKDMAVSDRGIVSFLDLEENPVGIMSLADAQARDVWLFLGSAAEFTINPRSELHMLLDVYQTSARGDLSKSLQKIAKSLRPFRRIISVFRARNISKDVKGAYWSTRLIEDLFLSFNS